jgi:dUTPase
MTEKPIYRFALREDIKDDKRFLPAKGEKFASGWDVRACQADKQPIVVEPFQYAKIPLGFRAFCPDGWWFELKPRSSTFAKKNLHALYGTIDESYEGQLVFACQYQPELKFCPDPITWDKSPVRIFDKSAYQHLEINFGEAIGQIIPVRRQEMIVKELSNDEYNEACAKRGGERKDGGFGSTDAK